MWTYFDLFCFRKIIYLSIFFSFHLFFPLLTLHCVYRHNVTTCPKQQWRANFSTAFKKGKKKVFAFQLLDIYVFMSVYNVCIQACVYAHTHFFICSSNKSLHCEACRFLFHIFAHPVKKKKNWYIGLCKLLEMLAPFSHWIFTLLLYILKKKKKKHFNLLSCQ